MVIIIFVTLTAFLLSQLMTNLGPLWFEGISKEFWRISFLWIDSYEALWFTGEVKE